MVDPSRSDNPSADQIDTSAKNAIKSNQANSNP